MADEMSEHDQPDGADTGPLVEVEPLTPEAFAPFGAVIAHGGGNGRCFVPAAFVLQDGVRPHLWVNRVALVRGALVHIRTIERHRFSAQNFLPLRGGRWLVVVAESGPGGQPHYERIRAFVTNAHQGISYRPGTWHHGLLALDTAAEVAVVMCLTGRDDDTEVEDLPWSMAVRIPPL